MGVLDWFGLGRVNGTLWPPKMHQVSVAYKLNLSGRAPEWRRISRSISARARMDSAKVRFHHVQVEGPSRHCSPAPANGRARSFRHTGRERRLH